MEFPLELDGEDSILQSDYIWRYVAYGAAIDLLYDYGEVDKALSIEPKYNRYRSLVYARTYQQQMNQRSTPRF